MKQYIWEYHAPITDRWHDGGGLMIITNGDYQEVWDKYFNELGLEGDSKLSIPDLMFNIESDVERVLTFPDVGCC